ncbi:MAG: hypothetical protein U0R17_03495 [Acidimicrobiia bacterium]
MVTARPPGQACITKQTVDFKQSTQNIDIIDCFERLLSAVTEANWGDRERLQLEVIALRAKYPRANRPLSSMLGKGLIECMNEFGAVVVYEPLDGEIEIKALTITGEGFIAQSYDRNNGLVSNIKYPTYPQRFAESLKASIDEILERCFSSRRWSQADIVEFLDTCHAFSEQYDRSRPIVDLKPNSLIPTPVKDLAR